MKRPSSIAIAPQLLFNIIISALSFADKTLLHLSGKCKLLEKLRFVFITCFLFLLRSLPSLFPITTLNLNKALGKGYGFEAKKAQTDDLAPAAGGDYGIARAIWQLLYAMNDIPVSSRKYELVRSLAERLIDENNAENSKALIDVNRRVLTASFGRMLDRLEAAINRNWRRDWRESVPYGLNRVMGAALGMLGDYLTGWGGDEADLSTETAEKLAAELLWLAEKMAACGFSEQAVEKWASASGLARLALSTEPRLQGSIALICALLLKQAKKIQTEKGEKERWRKTKKKMLMSWLPFLCRGSFGGDKQVLRKADEREMEKTIEDTIWELKGEEQEQVFALWLHHFTRSPSSDCPDLHASYARWCSTSRRSFLSSPISPNP